MKKQTIDEGLVALFVGEKVDVRWWDLPFVYAKAFFVFPMVEAAVWEVRRQRGACVSCGEICPACRG